MNIQKLKGRIIEKFGNMTEFYRQVGWSGNKGANIMAGRRDIKVSEMKETCRLLDIGDSEIREYFF